MSENATGRRGFLKGIGAAVAGTAAALIPREAKAEARRGEPEKAFGGRMVHYVGVTRHCIEATLVEENFGGMGAILQYQQRPPTPGTTYYQCSLASGKVEREDGDRQKTGTWHEAEGCPCGRPYSEFYYGRKRKKPEEPVLGGYRREAYGSNEAEEDGTSTAPRLVRLQEEFRRQNPPRRGGSRYGPEMP